MSAELEQAPPVDYVSTGRLPSPDRVQEVVDDAYQRYRWHAGGEDSRVYPALASVDGDISGSRSRHAAVDLFAAATPSANSRS